MPHYTIRADWLAQGSFMGEEKLADGTPVEHWTIEGQYLNHYVCLAAPGRLAKKFYEYKTDTKPPKLKQWDFVTLDQIDAVPSGVFDAPAGCTDACKSPLCGPGAEVVV